MQRQHAPRHRRTTHPVFRLVLALGAVLVVVSLVVAVALQRPAQADPDRRSTSGPASARKSAGNVVTPGNFTGYGFDQCLAPPQWKMNKWLQSSPFLAVGIYISGASRGCRDQPNLTPTWVSTQLANGWRLLPITLGPQASCHPGFPRYGNDPTINPKAGKTNQYGRAARQGAAEADTTVAEATRLGITPGSTLWYDLEGFNVRDAACRESALSFVSAWTARLHELGYASGVYSSAGSGIKMLDDARVERPGTFVLPDRIWVARWDGAADTSTSYIREDGWRPGGRMKQFQGGHDERWGGVKINIDRNYLDLGLTFAAAEDHCSSTRVNFENYSRLVRSSSRTSSPDLVKALQCLLKERGSYDGPLNGTFNPALLDAMHAWQTRTGFAEADRWSRRNWITLHSAGAQPVVKLGSAGEVVRRLQRALNSASGATQLDVSGVFDGATDAALRAWQKKNNLEVSGVAGDQSWSALQRGAK
jgi:hypothetical protein